MAATVGRDSDGNILINDPDAAAMASAVEKHNCRLTMNDQSDRVDHFRKRAEEIGHTGDSVVIVLANVDDRNGAELAAVLMPKHDWQQYRDRGEVPFARGLAGRDGVQAFLDIVDVEAAEKLRKFHGVAVVVIDRGVAEVF